MTPEGKIKARVKRTLLLHRAACFMPVQTGYGSRALDFMVWTKQGYPLHIETKAPNATSTGPVSRPTASQQDFAAKAMLYYVPPFLVFNDATHDKLSHALMFADGADHDMWVRHAMRLARETWVAGGVDIEAAIIRLTQKAVRESSEEKEEKRRAKKAS